MKAIVSLGTFLAATILHGAAIEQVIVRQQWPWSTDVKVEYKLSGVTIPINLVVEAYNGEQKLDSTHLAAAITGDRYGIRDDGVGRIVIDPVCAFGTEKVALANFKVKLIVQDAGADIDEVLYKIIDLTDWSVTDVKRYELLNGKYGTVETDFGKIGEGYNTSLSDVIIWTDLTNNAAYKRTKLVMRKIPAQAAGAWTMGAPAGERGQFNDSFTLRETPHQVTLTKDYWMAVFEWTVAQNKAADNDPTYSETDADQPYTFAAWKDMPGKFAKLTTNTGLTFGYPTEAQWEFACRAGTTNALYTGFDHKETGQGDQIAEIGWCNGIPGITPSAKYAVGQKRPNAFGLYDMIGSAAEWTNDWYYDGALGDLNQPIDPTGAASNASDLKMLRGGSSGHQIIYARSGCRSISVSTTYYNTTIYGWRFTCIAE